MLETITRNHSTLSYHHHGRVPRSDSIFKIPYKYELKWRFGMEWIGILWIREGKGVLSMLMYGITYFLEHSIISRSVPNSSKTRIICQARCPSVFCCTCGCSVYSFLVPRVGNVSLFGRERVEWSESANFVCESLQKSYQYRTSKVHSGATFHYYFQSES